MLGQLNARDQEIMRLRWGLGGRAPHTLEEVGDLLGLTRERIRQIEIRVMSLLRMPSAQAGVRDLLDVSDDE